MKKKSIEREISVGAFVDEGPGERHFVGRMLKCSRAHAPQPESRSDLRPVRPILAISLSIYLDVTQSSTC